MANFRIERDEHDNPRLTEKKAPQKLLGVSHDDEDKVVFDPSSVLTDEKKKKLDQMLERGLDFSDLNLEDKKNVEHKSEQILVAQDAEDDEGIQAIDDLENNESTESDSRWIQTTSNFFDYELEDETSSELGFLLRFPDGRQRYHFGSKDDLQMFLKQNLKDFLSTTTYSFGHQSYSRQLCVQQDGRMYTFSFIGKALGRRDTQIFDDAPRITIQFLTESELQNKSEELRQQLQGEGLQTHARTIISDQFKYFFNRTNEERLVERLNIAKQETQDYFAPNNEDVLDTLQMKWDIPRSVFEIKQVAGGYLRDLQQIVESLMTQMEKEVFEETREETLESIKDSLYENGKLKLPEKIQQQWAKIVLRLPTKAEKREALEQLLITENEWQEFLSLLFDQEPLVDITSPDELELFLAEYRTLEKEYTVASPPSRLRLLEQRLRKRSRPVDARWHDRAHGRVEGRVTTRDIYQVLPHHLITLFEEALETEAGMEKQKDALVQEMKSWAEKESLEFTGDSQNLLFEIMKVIEQCVKKLREKHQAIAERVLENMTASEDNHIKVCMSIFQERWLQAKAKLSEYQEETENKFSFIKPDFDTDHSYVWIDKLLTAVPRDNKDEISEEVDPDGEDEEDAFNNGADVSILSPEEVQQIIGYVRREDVQK